jgi:transposase InsO family protein
MPFGLTNAPATFQRLMERVLEGLQWQICLVYIDDIIIFSQTFEQHLKYLEEIFIRLRAAGLRLKPKKCSLFRQKVKYLGHEVSAEGIATDPEKTKVVREWPVPHNVGEVRSFLGLCSYYRRFVGDFATLAKPLTKLTEKSVTFNWGEPEQKSFEALKEKLVTSAVLAFPDRDATFILDTDASDVGIGAVLSQELDGAERVIAYGSRVLTKPERRYCVTRRELLAVVHFVKQYRHFLCGKQFILRTDHASLRWLKSFKEPEGQLARWLETLDTYNFHLIHRPGKKHINADALSRGPCHQCSLDHDGERIHTGRKRRDEAARPVRTRGQVRGDSGVQPADPGSSNWLLDTKLSPDELKGAQMSDPVLSEVHTWIQSGERPEYERISHHGAILKFYWGQFRSLKMVGGILVRELDLPNMTIRRQILLPPTLTKEVLTHCHDGLTGGHFGQTKTLANVTRRFLWPGMRREVNLYIKSCDTCSRYKAHGKKARASLKDHRVGMPMERVCIDIAGPFPESNGKNKYALIVTDWFTKYVEIYAMPNQEASTVAQTLTREFFSRYGVPHYLHSDQGTNFESKLFAGVCKLLGIQKTRTTPFRPQSDGQSERNIKTLIKMVAMTAEHQSEWDEHLPFLSMAYRSTPHESSGLTPNFMMYGRELAMPIDVMIGPSPDQELSPLVSAGLCQEAS